MTVSFHQLHNLKSPFPIADTPFHQLHCQICSAVLLRASLVRSCQRYQICPPISLAGLHTASVVTVHAAADTETVGFSAAGVDEGQMGKDGVGCWCI